MSGLIKKISCAVCAGILIALIICGIFFPEWYNDKLPYGFYNVLTNSMEPEITTNSLVLVKTYGEDMDIKENDIITFRAKRFGEDIIITHRFSHTEINENGQVIYRTHPEQSEGLDPYETKQEDLLGIYVFHIPYAGKLVLFLKSRFGLLWLCQVFMILMIKQTIIARWKEKESIVAES